MLQIERWRAGSMDKENYFKLFSAYLTNWTALEKFCFDQ
jgi:hypothetical protein